MPPAAADTSAAPRRIVTKSELRKIKQRVAKLRKQGHDIWTDDEIEREGYTLDIQTKPGGLHVPKKKQEEAWDCGLACVQMTLNMLGHTPTNADLLARLSSNSVWSIDLAYLLTEYGVECEFVTANAAMDATAYRGNAFYKDCLAYDERRVACLFCAAAIEGVAVAQRTLSATDLWNLMREEDTVIIMLVDAAKLHSRVSADALAVTGTGAPTAPRTVVGGGDTDFLGHYVLITGLDDERGGFLINDPARDDERTFVHSAPLEAARLAEGTDQDLILIPVYQDTPPQAPADPKPKIVRVIEEATSTQ